VAISRARRAQIERDGATETKFDDTGIRYSTKNLKKDQIRLVPVPEDMKLFKRIGTHFVFGKPFTCPRVTHGESCPLCELRSELRNSDDKDEKKLSEEIKVSIRYALRVISRKDQAEHNNIPSRVFILEAPKAIFDVVYSTMTGLDPNDEDSEPDWEEAIDLSDPFKGHDVSISKSGKKWNEIKYGAKVRKDASKLHSSKKVRVSLRKEAKKIDLEEWATHDNDLDEVVQKIINGESFDDDDDDRPRKGKKGKKKRRDDGYDDDLPRKGKKKKKKDKKKGKKKKGTMDELEAKMKAKKRKRKNK